jgi:ATP-dependent Clp protease ATP-binding subunit ClpX
VHDRVTLGRDRGALQPTTVVEGGAVRQEIRFELGDWLRSEDLFDYGMSPQFLSRFEAVVLLENLGVDQLVEILISSPNSGLERSREYFKQHDIELVISPAAIRKVAEVAAARPRMGARALNEVFRRVIRGYEFDPSQLTDGAVMIDLAEVEAALGENA